MTTPANVRRNNNLDALRAIAIFMVLGRHFFTFPAYATYWWARTWLKVGWAGVDLFFVLSGFLVSGLLFDEFRERGKIDVSRFYIRRGLKIWPAFYALIATGLLISLGRGHGVATAGLLPELFFVQSYFPGIWTHTWSLAVEEHFYLILPVALLPLMMRQRERPFATMPYIFGAVAVFCLACRFAVGWKESGTGNYLRYGFPTHLRIDGLMFGVLLSYYKRFQPAVFNRIAAWRGGWIVVAASVALLSTLSFEEHNMHTWGVTVLYLASGLLVAKAVAFEGSGPVQAMANFLAGIGVYSYSIYLWHMFYQERVLSHLHITSFTLWCALYLPGAILFGIVAAKIIEFPVLRFRDRVFPRSSKSSLVSKNRPSAEELEERVDLEGMASLSRSGLL